MSTDRMTKHGRDQALSVPYFGIPCFAPHSILKKLGKNHSKEVRKKFNQALLSDRALIYNFSICKNCGRSLQSGSNFEFDGGGAYM